MLFRRLLESYARHTLLSEGTLASIAAHTFLIGVAVVATNTGLELANEAEHFTSVQFFTPKDRLGGGEQQRERITWMPLTVGAQSEGQKEVPNDSDKLRLLKVKGEGEEVAEVQYGAPPPQESEVAGQDTIMTVLEVDTAVARYEDSAAPPYPKSMLDKKIEGAVAVQYVVDTTGLADTTSFRVLETTHDDFSYSVRSTLPIMRFRPAVMGSRKVRQLVQQMFSFRIDTTLLAREKAKPQL